MSKRVRNTSVPKWNADYKSQHHKQSKNAKRNKTLNGGRTSASYFYLIFGAY